MTSLLSAGQIDSHKDQTRSDHVNKQERMKREGENKPNGRGIKRGRTRKDGSVDDMTKDEIFDSFWIQAKIAGLIARKSVQSLSKVRHNHPPSTFWRLAELYELHVTSNQGTPHKIAVA